MQHRNSKFWGVAALLFALPLWAADTTLPVPSATPSPIAPAAALLAEPLNPAPAPPYQVPLFDGDPQRSKAQPKGKLVMPPLPSARELFDLVVACWPERSYFRGELSMEARAMQRGSQTSSSTTLDPVSGQYTTTQGNSVGLVLRIPLWSSLELDRVRARELQRRETAASAVGLYVAALAEHELLRRELTVQRALERRAQERVALGITETAEQLAVFEKVAALEARTIKADADVIKSRIVLAGMCDDTRVHLVDDYLNTFRELR